LELSAIAHIGKMLTLKVVSRKVCKWSNWDKIEESGAKKFFFRGSKK
jgi:hypothetical protein